MIKVLRGKKGSNVYVADIWVNGKRKRPRFPTRKAAQDWLDDTRVKTRRGEQILTSADVWTFEEAATRFYEERSDKHAGTNRRPRTLVNYRHTL